MRRERGDEIDDLLSCLVGTTNGRRTGKLGDLGKKRPSGREIRVEFGTDFDGTDFYAPAVIIGGHVVGERGMWISEEGGQIGVEGRLIGFDSEDHVSFPEVNRGQKVDLRVQSIGSVDTPCDGQTGKQLLSNGDLIGLLRDAHLDENFLAVVGTKGEQMRGFLLVGGRTAYAFAVSRDRIISLGVQGDAEPIRQGPFQMLGTQTREQNSIERIAGTEKAPGTKEPF